MKKDHDLAVGRLALRADLITFDQLTLATEAMSSDEATSMGEVLESRGFIDAPARIELERIAVSATVAGDDPGMGALQALSGRLRGPEERPSAAPAPKAATSETIALSPGSAMPETVAGDPRSAALSSGSASETVAIDSTSGSVGAIRRGGPAVASSATVAFGDSTSGPVLIAHLEEISSGHAKTRYSRTQMHAKGGIGQVWLARDGDLGREVALKELRPEQGKNPNAWARFVEEARITGQLEHPGIVPVYELSTAPADGKPFYTMRFIRGGTLNEAVHAYHEKKAAGLAGPLELASLLNAFVALCNTAGYAHSRGVIHRDLKGQNVVLGDFGEVMLLDWGIAKLLNGPASSEGPAADTESPVSLDDDETLHEATVQGQVIGTPSYMAPEQAEGRLEAIDAKTDVYGLGAILYEILAGRPPYEGTSTKEVLRKVREEPPVLPRQVDPKTPRALEAICLKAMAKKPDDRYPSALALAEEVRRWLADEPVAAYREPWPTRVARWAKRHRTEVAAAAALLVMAVVGLSTSTVLIGRERDEARRQRQQARKAVDDNYTRVAETWLADRLDPLQREFLEKALAYYRDFAGPDEGDPGLRQERGRAHLRMGDVLRKLGRHDDAEPAYRQSIAILSKLASDQPAADEHRDHLAEATFRLGSERATRTRASELDEAGRLFRQAAETQEALVADAPSTPRRVALGRTLVALADLLRTTGQPADSEATYRKAITLLEKAAADEPAEASPRMELAASLDGLATLLKDRGRLDEAKAIGRRSTEVFEKLVAEAPTLPSPRDGLAKAYNNLALVLRKAGAPSADSEAVLDKEVALNRRLAEDYPARPEYRRTLARGLMNLGIIYREAHRTKLADAAYSQALKFNEKLAAESPEVRKYARDWATCLNNLAELRASRKGESEPLYRKALEIDRALVAETPGVPEHRIAEAGVLQNLGSWLSDAGRVDEAIATLKRGVELFDELALADPDDRERRRLLARTLNSLGIAYLAGSHFPEAEDAFRRAENAFDQLVARPPVLPADRLELAACLSNRGTNQTEGKLPGAEDSLRRSLALLDTLASEGPPSPDLRFRLGAARSNFGDWLASAGQFEPAEASYRTALGLFGGLASESPEIAAYKGTLGQVRSKLGEFLAGRGRPDEARPLLEEGIREERAALASNPQARDSLRRHLAILASLDLDRKAHAEAAKSAEELLRVASDLPSARAEVARLMVRCIPMASADTRITEARRAVMAGTYADRAIALLREAVESGDPEVDRLLRDSAFDPIRTRDGFKALEPEKIGRVEAPDRPIR
jgi:eukaryotic-like serine/threonine-protein kinase